MKQLTLALIALTVSLSVAAQTLNGFDVSNSTLPKGSLVSGGPPRDGIPSIDEPRYVSAGDATFMQSDDVVLGLVMGDTAIAYPRHILNWHELVNDVIGGEPVLISYCPLCGTGMAFSATVDGQALTFGVSGLLFNNDLVFYDRATESLWSQIDRKAVAGALVGEELTPLPLHITSWSAWLAAHPDSRVLSDDQGVKRNYRHDPYSGYETTSQLFFKTLRKAPRIFHTKERILGVEINGETMAFAFSTLRDLGAARFEQTIGGETVTITWDTVHQAAAAYANDGSLLPATVGFWFAWYNFHPDTLIFRPADNNE
ncbi:MAG: DUF3179 domain-containing protein [Pseudomonadota bacterium]